MLAICRAEAEIEPLVTRLTVDAQRVAYIVAEHFAVAHIHHAAAIEKDASLVNEVTAFDDVALAVDQLVVEEKERAAAVPEILLLTRGVDLQEEARAVQMQWWALEVLETRLMSRNCLAVSFAYKKVVGNFKSNIYKSVFKFVEYSPSFTASVMPRIASNAKSIFSYVSGISN